jgi:hypothetical protein
MAALKSIGGHQAALEQPVFPQGFLGEVRAGGLEGADLTLLWGKGFLIEGDGRHNRFG